MDKPKTRYFTDPEFKARTDAASRQWRFENYEYNKLRNRLYRIENKANAELQGKVKRRRSKPMTKEEKRLYMRKWRKRLPKKIKRLLYRIKDPPKGTTPEQVAAWKAEYQRGIQEYRQKRRTKGLAALLEECTDSQVAKLKTGIARRALKKTILRQVANNPLPPSAFNNGNGNGNGNGVTPPAGTQGVPVAVTQSPEPTTPAPTPVEAPSTTAPEAPHEAPPAPTGDTPQHIDFTKVSPAEWQYLVQLTTMTQTARRRLARAVREDKRVAEKSNFDAIFKRHAQEVAELKAKREAEWKKSVGLKLKAATPNQPHGVEIQQYEPVACELDELDRQILSKAFKGIIYEKYTKTIQSLLRFDPRELSKKHLVLQGKARELSDGRLEILTPPICEVPTPKPRRNTNFEIKPIAPMRQDYERAPNMSYGDVERMMATQGIQIPTPPATNAELAPDPENAAIKRPFEKYRKSKGYKAYAKASTSGDNAAPR